MDHPLRSLESCPICQALVDVGVQRAASRARWLHESGCSGGVAPTTEEEMITDGKGVDG
jgi:hypothetical protein